MKKLLFFSILLFSLTSIFAFDLPFTADSETEESLLEIISEYIDIKDILESGNKVYIECSDDLIENDRDCIAVGYCEYNDEFLNGKNYNLDNCVDRVSELEQISFRSVRGALPYSPDPNNLIDLCILSGEFDGKQQSYHINETILDTYAPNANIKKYVNSNYTSFSYEEKCNEIKRAAFEYKDETGVDWYMCLGPGSNSCSMDYVTIRNEMSFISISELEISEAKWISTNELVITEIENPINLVINTYSKEYPDFDFKGVYPSRTTLVIDASSSSPEGITLKSPNLAETESLVFELPFSGPSDGEVTQYITFSYTDETGSIWEKDYPWTGTVEDTVFSSISTTSSNIKPNEFTTFTIRGDSLSSDTLSYFFDSGQRKKAYGELIEVSGSIQCKEFPRENGLFRQCLIDDALYEGTPQIGNNCGCNTDDGSKAIYIGQKAETLSETSFEEFIPVKYDSKDSCGEDRTCEATLTVTSSSGLSSTKSIILNLPSAETCNLFSNSIEQSTNTSSLVGKVEDGTISCYCKVGYKPVIDTSSSLPGTSSAKKCIKEVVKTETNTTTQKPPIIPTPSPPPPESKSPYTPPSNADIDEYDTKEPLEAESGSNLAIIFLILILICALVVAGFEFYERKKTGSFVNPFSKFMKKSPKTLSTTEDSKTISPIQRFITQARTAGESNDTIRQNLKNSGWPEEEINKYL